MAANQDDEVTFFCGGSRNFKQFIDVFDEVFILDGDAETLNERLDRRPDEYATKQDIPSRGLVLDATQSLLSFVDEIIRHVGA